VTRVLVVNAGSSSLKLRVLSSGRLSWRADLAPSDSVAEALGTAGPVDAAGHRIVHGGTAYTSAVVIDAEVLKGLEALTELAPLHQPAALAGVRAVSAALPGVPQVACFDTAFHATLPAVAATYALPDAWRTRWGLRRYGFHGLSHSYASRRAAVLLGADPAAIRVVSCHLGAGASLAAVQGGRCVDTTMGFTPLEGLVMATRSGTVDPGLLLWLQTSAGLSAREISETLERRSGLSGLAGTADMREVLDRSDPAAVLAVGVYLHRLRGSIAAMAAATNGLDVLVFTGGVGENAPKIREKAMAGLGFLGVRADPLRNGAGEGDREIGASGAAVRCLVIEAREDIEIARQVRELLAAYDSSSHHAPGRSLGSVESTGLVVLLSVSRRAARRRCSSMWRNW
jgi:acetate kinase